MQKTVIVTIGGTGQLFLHFHTQLFLTGYVREPFDALVIDTDDCLPSLRMLSRLFEDVARVSPTLAVPSIRYVHVAPPPGETVREVLTGRLDDVPHPVSYLFSRSDLVQSTAQGLYARPALASVIREKQIVPDVSFGNTERVITVSSITGGTGGGLTAPVLQELSTRIQQTAEDRCSLRSIFFGQWFEPDAQRMADARERLASNELMVAQTLAALAPPSLYMYSFIRPDQLRPRDVARERLGQHLPWPEPDHPMAVALSVAARLIAEAVRPASSDFGGKELSPPNELERLPAAMTLARRRIDFVDTCVRRRIVARTLAEPFVHQVWDDALPALLKRAYRFAVSRSVKDLQSPGTFARALQSALTGEWGRVKGVFPAWAADHSFRPSAVASHVWRAETLECDQDKDIASDRGTFLRVIAVNLLFRAMRETVNEAY